MFRFYMFLPDCAEQPFSWYVYLREATLAALSYLGFTG